MLLPGVEIIDPRALFATIAAEIAAEPDPRNGRALAVRHLAQAKTAANAALAAAFALRPLEARALTRAQSFLTDGLVTVTFDLARQIFHPLPTPT